MLYERILKYDTSGRRFYSCLLQHKTTRVRLRPYGREAMTIQVDLARHRKCVFHSLQVFILGVYRTHKCCLMSCAQLRARESKMRRLCSHMQALEKGWVCMRHDGSTIPSICLQRSYVSAFNHFHEMVEKRRKILLVGTQSLVIHLLLQSLR
jgi:hypothetical protein